MTMEECGLFVAVANEGVGDSEEAMRSSNVDSRIHRLEIIQR
eukprot:CAMPEP_0196150794 /NCGR_PEP_ID=MMETSP0910-20130528/32438_1 /TAXON_ID=49265 /ORGANISM="Thalassiosira rotula, Strain GSO102" /LENGTH=41 /DNA_ID= /DNA_START= /DNA_END= /DNA_ORIENTATION=